MIVGDFLEVPAEDLGRVQAVIGNPPFQSETVAAFLRKSHEILEEGGQAGFILPAYILQTSSSVERIHSLFSIRQAMIPRNLFPGLSLPLCFATFTKERQRRLHGFMLYREAQEIAAIDGRWKQAVATGRDSRGVWFPVVREILRALGGCADLKQIYGSPDSESPLAREGAPSPPASCKRLRAHGAGSISTTRSRRRLSDGKPQ